MGATARVIGTEPAPRKVAPEPGRHSHTDAVSMGVFGVGGLGVVGLARRLASALALRYPRVATAETRGIAQRRAPVRALLRAGTEVRSAASPDSCLDLVVALEAGEALRAVPWMTPGSHCLLLDLRLPSPGRPDAAPVDPGPALSARGVVVHDLAAAAWLEAGRRPAALVSAIAFGALARGLDLPGPACAALVESNRPADLDAFYHGQAQCAPAALLARPGAAR